MCCLNVMCKQKDPKTNELEGLLYEFDLCEALATWEQVSSPDACILLRDVHKTWELISFITVSKCISSFFSHPFLMSSLISFTIDLLFSELIAQVRNSTTILTREFIDALPNGWEDYAWRRINKGVLLLVPYMKTFFRINKSWMIM